MWTRKLLKTNAKVAFKRNYWTCVIVSFLAILLGASTSGRVIEYEYQYDTEEYYEEYYDDSYYDDYGYEDDDILDTIYSIMVSPIFIAAVAIVLILVIAFTILVSNIITVGHKRYYLENREHKTKISKLFYGFSGGRYGNTVWVMFWKELYLVGWTLLFIVPGIIKGYSYMMIPYILAENPDVSKERAFQISRQMMNGHKWEAFVLNLSFLGWQLLSAIPLVRYLWTAPYVDATIAEYYSAIKAEAFQKGITDETELPGVGYPEFTEQF